MSIKKIIKQICYGANRNSREEIIQSVQCLRDELVAMRANSESEFQRLRQDLIELGKQLSDLREENDSLVSWLREKEQNNSMLTLSQTLAEKTEEIKKEICRFDANSIHTQIDVVQRDILLAISQKEKFLPKKKVKVITDYPIAYESNDHKSPWGTKNDNTRAPYFVQKCEEILGEKLNFMDLGCSGGGLVLDEILKGHFAIGLEGSDYSKKHQRAEWRLLRNNLFTCDVCKPFEVQEYDTGTKMQFDIITAWELLEHIKEQDISSLLRNIHNHLSDTGYFVGTMSQNEDVVDGVTYHHTVKPYIWWKDKFENYGFDVIENLFSKMDLARGNGNPPNVWMLGWGDENSSFIVAKKK